MTRRRIKPLALKLVNLLYIHGFRYFPSYESWAEKKVGTENSWQVVPYTYITEMSYLFLAGSIGDKVERELVKDVLMQIERWMLASFGELVFLERKKKRSQWYPICLVESEDNNIPQVGDRATTKI